MVSSFAISPIARVLLLHGNHSRLIGFKVYVHRFSRPEEKNKILRDSFLGNGGQLFRWCRMQDSNPYEITNGSYVLHSPFFPLEEQSVSDRNRTENSIFVSKSKLQKTPINSVYWRLRTHYFVCSVTIPITKFYNLRRVI